MDLQLRNLDVAEVPELEPDPYHPQNDQFNRSIEQVKRAIVAHQRTMTPKHVNIVKLHHLGHTNVKIAELENVTPATVGRVIHSKAGARLADLLAYLQASLDGPTFSHRKAVLHRLVVDNEGKDNRIVIAAIAEMNKMEHQEYQRTLDPNAPTQINITINQDTFPRTVLDG